MTKKGEASCPVLACSQAHGQTSLISLATLDAASGGESVGLDETNSKSIDIPKFKKSVGESTRQYLDRVDRETNVRLMEQYKKGREKSDKKRKLVIPSSCTPLLSRCPPLTLPSVLDI